LCSVARVSGCLHNEPCKPKLLNFYKLGIKEHSNITESIKGIEQGDDFSTHPLSLLLELFLAHQLFHPHAAFFPRGAMSSLRMSPAVLRDPRVLAASVIVVCHRQIGQNDIEDHRNEWGGLGAAVQAALREQTGRGREKRGSTCTLVDSSDSHCMSLLTYPSSATVRVPKDLQRACMMRENRPVRRGKHRLKNRERRGNITR